MHQTGVMNLTGFSVCIIIQQCQSYISPMYFRHLYSQSNVLSCSCRMPKCYACHGVLVASLLLLTREVIQGREDKNKYIKQFK